MAHLRCDFRSDAMGMNTSMTVILPEKTDLSQVPVVYLLHGLEDNCTGWARYTSVERYAREKNAALVMPEVQRSFYADMDRGLPYFTFIHDELPEICRGFFGFSAKREKNYLMGLSMGGYGAIRNGLKYHKTFSHIAGLSSGIMLEDILNSTNEPVMPFMRRSYYESVFGDLSQLEGSDMDYKALICKLKEEKADIPKIYLCCGTEDFLLKYNRDYRDFLTEKGVAVTYEEGPGAHEWDFWDTYIKKVMEWLPLDEGSKGLNSGNVGVE